MKKQIYYIYFGLLSCSISDCVLLSAILSSRGLAVHNTLHRSRRLFFLLFSAKLLVVIVYSVAFKNGMLSVCSLVIQWLKSTRVFWKVNSISANMHYICSLCVLWGGFKVDLKKIYCWNLEEIILIFAYFRQSVNFMRRMLITNHITWKG